MGGLARFTLNIVLLGLVFTFSGCLEPGSKSARDGTSSGLGTTSKRGASSSAKANEHASDFFYTTNPAKYTKGFQILANRPVLKKGKGTTNYSINKELPSGLSFDTQTGIISGAPVTISRPDTYQITTSTNKGSFTTSLIVEIVDVAPAGLHYSSNPAIYTKDQQIIENKPAPTGGVVSEYIIDGPPLPAGLGFNAFTGVISGTPKVVTPKKTYVITAKNSGGSVSVGVEIAVNDVAPSALKYETNPAVYTRGKKIPDNKPLLTGGVIEGYAIDGGPLPQGLNFNTSTGVISGTPTVLASKKTYTVTAKNSGGSVSGTLDITVNDVAPSGLGYSANPVIYAKDMSITPNAPILKGGGAVSKYTSNKSLPEGLSFNTSTGVISGRPTKLTEKATYIITAENSGGSNSVGLDITVNDAAPAFNYSENPAKFTMGKHGSHKPIVSGGAVTSYIIEGGALPKGIQFNSSTGEIFGRSEKLLLNKIYKISTKNTGGSTFVLLAIEVVDDPPTSLKYSSNPAVYTINKQITVAEFNKPTSKGGVVTEYKIKEGVLPEGLSFNASTGVISGTPTKITEKKKYTIIAKNSGGETSVDLDITVNDVPPSKLSYTPGSAEYTKNKPIDENKPKNEGGAVTEYKINEALPAGLTLDIVTGIISGKPTAVAEKKTYKITAKNSGGEVSADLDITVNEPLTALTYSTASAKYTKGKLIEENKPTLTGGGSVTEFTIVPELPAGLSLNSSTGVVSGTPTVIASKRMYKITAKNSGGSASATIDITVNDTGPSGLSYLTNPAVYFNGEEIIKNVPEVSGKVTRYFADKPLPAGLSLDSQTGIISGTPTATTDGAKAITITAENSGGKVSVNLSINVRALGSIIGIKGTLATGYAHTCALVDGGIQCWGNNQGGQLGDGTNVGYRFVPAPVVGIDGISPLAVTVGDLSTCAIVGAGHQVYCWGLNHVGQLGNGTTKKSNVPVRVKNPTGQEDLTGVSAIAAGSDFVCAIQSSKVLCWGGGAFGQLGHGKKKDSSYPVYVIEFDEKTGKRKALSGVRAIAAGGKHVCAIVSQLATAHGGDTVKCWGRASEGQLGSQDAFNEFSKSGNDTRTIPVDVDQVGGGGGKLSGVRAIAAGKFHTCAILGGSEIGVACWGLGTSGQLLLADDTLLKSPTPIRATISFEGVAATIAAGEQHTCVLGRDGKVKCHGAPSFIRAGEELIDGGVQALASGSGAGHTCAIVGGAIKCWGFSTRGQFGNGEMKWPDTDKPETKIKTLGLKGGPQVVSTSVGGDHTCAIVGGNAWCWGDNKNGQLGDGTQTNSSQPVAVRDENGEVLKGGFQAVSAGDQHTCAIRNGLPYCWGLNVNGQLGDDTFTSRAFARAINNLHSHDVSAGLNFSCAHSYDKVYCWGLNEAGRLGNPTVGLGEKSPLPVALIGPNGTSGLTGVQKLIAGYSHSCVLATGNTWCWGDNKNGQFAIGANSNNPHQFATASFISNGISEPVQDIQVGKDMSCFHKDGAMFCSGANLGSSPAKVEGDNNNIIQIAAAESGLGYVSRSLFLSGSNKFGQLGDGTLVSREISAFKSVAQFSSQSGSSAFPSVHSFSYRGDHACAISLGKIYCWGKNDFGQAGGGSTNSPGDTSPVEVMESWN